MPYFDIHLAKIGWNINKLLTKIRRLMGVKMSPFKIYTSTKQIIMKYLMYCMMFSLIMIA